MGAVEPLAKAQFSLVGETAISVGDVTVRLDVPAMSSGSLRQLYAGDAATTAVESTISGSATVGGRGFCHVTSHVENTGLSEGTPGSESRPEGRDGVDPPQGRSSELQPVGDVAFLSGSDHNPAPSGAVAEAF